MNKPLTRGELLHGHASKYAADAGHTVSMTWPQYLRSQAIVDGALVRVPAFAKEALLMLLLNRGRTLSITSLVEAIWPDPDLQPDGGTIYVQRLILELRRYGIPIETVIGSAGGYRIPAPSA